MRQSITFPRVFLLCLLGLLWRPVAADMLTVSAPQAKVRAGPGPTQPILTSVPRGTRFASLATQQGWHRIRLDDGREGWIADTVVQRTQEARALTVMPSASPDAPQQLYRASWAVVIGVNTYLHPQVPPLRYAVQDANSVIAALAQLGFPPERVFLLLNEQATKRAIEDVLYERLRAADKDDRLLVFFAGHGITVPLPRGATEGFLLSYDADPERLFTTAISMADVKRMGSRIAAKHILFVVDACYSGFSVTRAVAPPRSDARYLRLATQEPAVQVITAGKANEQVREEDGHGLFTRHFLQGLTGFADTDQDGAITGLELAAFLQSRVNRATDGAQHPQFGQLAGEGQFVFVLPEAGGASPSTAEAPAVPDTPPTAPPLLTAAREGRPPELPPVSPALADQALAQGRFEHAERLFQQLVAQADAGVRSQGYAGLAAVALAHGQTQQAMDFATRAEALAPEMASTHVTRGHILWSQGKLLAAQRAYRTATEKPHAQSWPQAVAADRLGRIYAAEGFTGTALQYYDRAIGQQPEMAVVYANKAYLLEQLGRRQEALGLYRQALQMAPDDRVTATLLRAAEQRDRLAQNPSQQTELVRRVQALLQAHQAGESPTGPDDAWTSPPLTLAFVSIQCQGSLAPRAGEEEVVADRLLQALQDSGRIVVLEQALLDPLLTALQRRVTDLAEPQLARQVGRILAAPLIGTGSIERAEAGEILSISLLEPHTGMVRARAEASWRLDNLDDVVAQLAPALLQQIQQAYPRRGRIIRVNPQGVELNVGTAQGITPGLTMHILANSPAPDPNRPVGLLEVTAVDSQRSQARVLHHTTTLEEGWRVQEGQTTP